MITLRKLEEKDRDLYFLACQQEPGCEHILTNQLYIDTIWKEYTEGYKHAYAIVDESNTFMGYVSIDNDDVPEMGISFLPEYQGKGYGAKAIDLLMRLINGERGTTKFTVRVDPSNTNCIKMIEKIQGAKRVESRSSQFMKDFKAALNTESLGNLSMDILETFNNSVYRYDIEYKS